jgi:hypothetical protein
MRMATVDRVNEGLVDPLVLFGAALCEEGHRQRRRGAASPTSTWLVDHRNLLGRV